jgi:hypothetical protein
MKNYTTWFVALVAMLIFKIFETVTSSIAVFDEKVYFFALCAFSLIYIVSLGGSLLKQKWGAGLAIFMSLIHIVTATYLGGSESMISVASSFIVVFFAYKAANNDA